MAATVKFVEDIGLDINGNDNASWSDIFKFYNEVLRAKAETKPKKSATIELIELDNWYNTDLHQEINRRDQRYLTHPELVKLMKWKLARGKFRPRLVQLAESNPPIDVERYSKDAFCEISKGDLKSAIQHLCKLRGIGPATASAVLAAGSPDKAAFMADEAVLGILGQIQLKYTLPEYLDYMEGINTCLKKLRKLDPDSKWDAHKVELTVWTHWWLHKLDMSIEELRKQPESKRKSEQSDKKTKKLKK